MLDIPENENESALENADKWEFDKYDSCFQQSHLKCSTLWMEHINAFGDNKTDLYRDNRLSSFQRSSGPKSK